MVGENWILSSRQDRRRAVQAIAAVGGGLLILRAGRNAAVPQAFAQEGDGDSSGHGRGRGRGRGGDEDNSGPGSAEDRQDQEAQAADVPADSLTVRIVGDDAGDFVPGELTVDVGQSVTFINEHSDEHTATGSGFDTGIIPEGGSVTVVLEEPGRFPYACQIHPEMTGEIAVRGPDGTVPERAAQTGPVPADAVTVRIANLAFDPSALTVQTGTTVAWTNDDSVPHTVTSLDGLFDSGIFDPGATFSWTFNEPGTLAYQCQLHPAMQGTVVAEGEPVAGADTAAAGTAAPAAEEPAQAAEQPAQQQENAVSIVDFAFEPNRLEIAAGATVVWTNTGQAPHTVTGDFADSGILDPGQTFSHTFADVGAFDYVCSLHPQMAGQIVVGAVTEASQAAGAEVAPASSAGVWLVELVPEDNAAIAPHHALVTLHDDGLVSADFLSVPEAPSSSPALSSGHGNWRDDGGGVAIDVMALVVDAGGRFGGTATMMFQGQLGGNGRTLEGTFEVSLVDAAGDPVAGGAGTFRGEAAPAEP